MSRQITLRLPDKMLEALDRRARRWRRPRSEIVKAMLEAQLSLPEVAAGGSALDRLRALDLVEPGPVGLPRDLATNPAHLAGFGERR